MGSLSSFGWTVSSFPVAPPTVTSGRRKARRAASAAKLQASIRFPSWSSTWTSHLTCQTLSPERITSDSVSRARLSRRLRSMIRVTSTAASPGRPGSNSGDAIGLNSTRNWIVPSLGLSGKGSEISAETTANTFVFPRQTVAEESSRENLMSVLLKSYSFRPSIRWPFANACLMKSFSTLEVGVTQRFISRPEKYYMEAFCSK
mmetsp:Transcript_11202/g.26570  ORF Transcript_11202/g.26570 Transcript_11202/m.26570 type:complete len:203 (-) Transcript_11202:44-652(-)